MQVGTKSSKRERGREREEAPYIARKQLVEMNITRERAKRNEGNAPAQKQNKKEAQGSQIEDDDESIQVSQKTAVSQSEIEKSI